jgi:probable rRNA maturation factor
MEAIHSGRSQFFAAISGSFLRFAPKELDLVVLHRRIAALSSATLERFVLRARRAAGLRGTTDVLVTSSGAMRSLNRQFRGKNKATDVLSFPANFAFRNGKTAMQAGEIAISAEIAAQNAARLGHSAAQEVKILTLHGILHLAGFDHERDNGEMAREEMKLRQALRLPIGLLQRSEPDPPTREKTGRGRSATRRGSARQISRSQISRPRSSAKRRSAKPR